MQAMQSSPALLRHLPPNFSNPTHVLKPDPKRSELAPPPPLHQTSLSPSPTKTSVLPNLQLLLRFAIPRQQQRRTFALMVEQRAGSRRSLQCGRMPCCLLSFCTVYPRRCTCT